jgi:hypothetical protein
MTLLWPLWFRLAPLRNGKQAKPAGFPAQNCQYFHTVAMPKKEGFKPEELNERGKYLLSEKDKQKAKDVKVEWLKNYPGGK